MICFYAGFIILFNIGELWELGIWRGLLGGEKDWERNGERGAK